MVHPVTIITACMLRSGAVPPYHCTSKAPSFSHALIYAASSNRAVISSPHGNVMHVPLLARAASAHQQSRYHRVAIKLHAPLLARAASHNGVGTMSTWKVLGDEKAYSRYLTVFDRKVQFTVPATGEVSESYNLHFSWGGFHTGLPTNPDTGKVSSAPAAILPRPHPSAISPLHWSTVCPSPPALTLFRRLSTTMTLWGTPNQSSSLRLCCPSTRGRTALSPR